jgi:hypothetical protein
LLKLVLIEMAEIEWYRCAKPDSATGMIEELLAREGV